MLEPVNARISVFVIVPIISLPIFIPDLNRCFMFGLSLTACISNTADDIETPTSITAPSAAIITPANNIPPILIGVSCAIKTNASASPVLKTVILARILTNQATSPATVTPMVVPIIAANVFLLIPFNKVSATTVETMPIITAAKIAGTPRNNIGKNI